MPAALSVAWVTQAVTLARGPISSGSRYMSDGVVWIWTDGEARIHCPVYVVSRVDG